MLRLFILHTVLVWVAIGEAQEGNGLAVRATTDVLGQLESMGVQVLSNILSPSTPASTASSASATPTSASASPISSSLDSSSHASALARPVSTSSPMPTGLSAADKENTRHRNLAIILGTVLGFVVLLLLLALLWFCCFSKCGRRARRRIGEKGIDDDELDAWKPAAPENTAYVTRIESWHEPRGSRNSSRGPPKGSQSRVSLIQRDIPDRYGTAPSAPVPLPVPAPFRTSQYGLIQNENAFDDSSQRYTGHAGRHSMDDAVRNPNKYPGYVPYRSSQSTHSLVEQSSTLLFGSGKTPGENHQSRRKSVGSGPTVIGSTANSKDPSPHGNGTGPWVPPKNPTRRRESLPGSPLAHEFEFGFEDQPRRISREHMSSGWSNTSVADAHQRF
jgi:hypothetical protein